MSHPAEHHSTWERLGAATTSSSNQTTAQLGDAIIPQYQDTPVACLILEVACRDFHTAPFAARKILNTYGITCTCRPRLRFAAVPSWSELSTRQALPCALGIQPSWLLSTRSFQSALCVPSTDDQSSLNFSGTCGGSLTEVVRALVGSNARFPGACACPHWSLPVCKTGPCRCLFRALFCSALAPAASPCRCRWSDPAQARHPTNKHVLYARESSHAGV